MGRSRSDRAPDPLNHPLHQRHLSIETCGMGLPHLVVGCIAPRHDHIDRAGLNTCTGIATARLVAFSWDFRTSSLLIQNLGGTAPRRAAVK